MTCRKNFIDLSGTERDDLADALNELESRGIVREFAIYHENNFGNGIHWGPTFLPWHRHFLLLFEEQLRSVKPNVRIPFWDWTRSDSQSLENEPWRSFFGGRSNSGGRFDHWDYQRAVSSRGELPILRPTGISEDPLVVVRELQPADYAEFRAIEAGSHVPGHVWVGGTMATGRSPLDPLFYLHHCNIDRLWAIWQQNHPSRPQYSTDNSSNGAVNQVPHAFVAEDELMVPNGTPSTNVPQATPGSVLDHLALSYRYPEDIALEAAWSAEGLGTLATGDPVVKQLQEPAASSGLDFRNVPEGQTTWRAAVFSIDACEPVTFEITSGPTVLTGASDTSFGTPLGTFVTVDPGTKSEGRIWLSYTGTSEGDSATGTVTIRCVETGETWDIDITATTIRRPTVGAMLVLDRSGSMESDAGDGRRRIDVLKEAAPVFVDLLREDDGVGVVRFDQDAQLVEALSFAGPLTSGAGRIAATAAIANHTPNPTGSTSVGDGIDVARTELSARASRFDETAIVVLTDGRENQPLFISDVAGDIGGRVFGIGLGAAEHINPAALMAITNGTGGYVLMTGVLDSDDQFILQKYYLQILAGVTNSDVILDPEGSLKPEQEHRIPFHISETDITIDVIALTGDAPPDILHFDVETPSGQIVNSGVGGVSVGAGRGSRFYRITLPMPTNAGEERTGTWHAVLRLNKKIFRRYLDQLYDDSRRDFPEGFHEVQAHGVRYSLNVHTTSNLQMQAQVAQSSMELGATLTVRAVLEEYGQKVTGRARVIAEMKRPDGTKTKLILSEGEPGVFETDIVASLSGVYRFRVLASGRTFRNRPFTREQQLTGAVWFGGDTSFPTFDHEPGKRNKRLCDLALCLLQDEVFGRYLKEREVNVDLVRRCVMEFGDKAHNGKETSGFRPVLDIEDLQSRLLNNSTVVESLTQILRDMQGNG